jgi:glutaredoxin
VTSHDGAAGPARITLLTQTNCNLCEHAKEVLARVSADVALQIETVDLSTDQGKRLAACAHVMFAPGVLIDDAPFSHGRLSERRLRNALRGRPAPAEQPTTQAEF